MWASESAVPPVSGTHEPLLCLLLWPSLTDHLVKEYKTLPLFRKDGSCRNQWVDTCLFFFSLTSPSPKDQKDNNTLMLSGSGTWASSVIATLQMRTEFVHW